MSHPSDLTRTLDENLARATPARSIFASEERTLENGSRKESLECFNHLYAAAAEGLSETTPCEPIGQGQPKERKKVGPMELVWKGKAWTATGAGFSLEIGPECDKNDTQGWLENFERIRTNVLRRQTTKREQLHFLLGRKANEREPKRCVAFAEDNMIGFPTTLNGSHLLAVKLCEASEKNALKPISLEKVTLHEIGHTLRNYFPFGREQIVVAMMHDGPECWHRATALLQEISPHYLGDQTEMIGPTLSANKLKAETEKTWEAKKAGNKFGFDIGREIFAELVRHFYLEPVLERKPRMFGKTGFYELDDICMTLIEESCFALTQNPKPLTEERELD